MTSRSNDQLPKLTLWLRRASAGETLAMDHCYKLVKDELRRIALVNMSEDDQRSIELTALIDDAWMSLIVDQSISWECRRQFFGYACTTIRNMLVDHARKRVAKKRNPDNQVLPLHEIADIPDVAPSPDANLENAEQTLAMTAAFERLKRNHPELAEVVNFRHHSGASFQYIADHLLNVHVSSVYRRWEQAKIVLHSYLKDTDLKGNE